MSNDYTTILIGNGLGMAVDPNHFVIGEGLKHGWSMLSQDQQKRIKNLITDKVDLDSEDQLDKHYVAIQACLMLNRIENHSNLAWLDSDAREFPKSFRRFVEDSAWHFFEYEDVWGELPPFLLRLENYILSHDTHLVTLNYDKLVYDSFVERREIINCPSPKLVDGFHVNSTGFDPSHLLDIDNGVGYYLHLHGSPFFYTDIETGIINKDTFMNYRVNRANPHYLREHLILCNTALKPAQISYSSLLNSYWDFFKHALNKSNKIILFGYSGRDIHVNKEISKVCGVRFPSMEVIIVEYSGQGATRDERARYWEEQLSLSPNYFLESNLIMLDSILSYSFPD